MEGVGTRNGAKGKARSAFPKPEGSGARHESGLPKPEGSGARHESGLPKPEGSGARHESGLPKPEGAGHGPGLGQRKGTGVRFLSPPDVVRWVDGFREVNASTKRYRVLMGSAGSGKSMNVAQDLIGKLSNPKFTGANLLVVRKLEEANRASTLPQLIQAAKAFYGSEWHRAWSVRREPLAMTSSVTGRQILFAGMNDLRQREKIKSVAFERGKLTFIWVEEATELSEADFDILDDRLRGRLPRNLYYQITLTFNPVSASHWLKSRFFDHPDPAALVHRSNYRDNPFMDAAYHRRMETRKKRDPEGYRVYGLGEWGGTEKMVLPTTRFGISTGTGRTSTGWCWARILGSTTPTPSWRWA